MAGGAVVVLAGAGFVVRLRSFGLAFGAVVAVGAGVVTTSSWPAVGDSS